MAYPGVFYSNDGQILQAMQTASNKGAMIMMHAENGIAIDVLIAQALARGETDPRYHGITRPWETRGGGHPPGDHAGPGREGPVYIVHMSAKQAVDTVAMAATRAGTSFGETCPQYLYLSLEEHLGPARLRGSQVRVLHAAAARAEGHQDELWKYLRTNDLSVVSTDHCPFCFKEQKELGLGDFSKIPNGIGGVEHRMDLIYQGVVDGHISLPPLGRAVPPRRRRACSASTRARARSPRARTRTSCSTTRTRRRRSASTTHHMNVDHSAYEGHVVPGRVHTVLSRGHVVIDDGEYGGAAGHGRFLKRDTCQYLV